jgi:hypothetical protein
VIVVWGWRVRRKTLREGTFFSPATGKDGPFRLVEARRWFTLFWIPLIPLKVIGTYVECGATKQLFDPRVLDTPTNASLDQQLGATVRDLVATVAVGCGPLSAPARAAAIEVVAAHVPGYDKEALRADIAAAPSPELPARLDVLAAGLAEAGKERLVADVGRVAAACDAGARGRGIVEQAGRDLGLSAAHVRGIVAGVLDPDPAP